MLYEKYYKRTMRRAYVFGVIRRFRVLILAALLVIVAAVALFMGFYGYVYDIGDFPDTLIYGESFESVAKAFIGGVSYEYSLGGSEWVEDVPKDVGTYDVRCVSRNIFGGVRYSSTFTLEIVPREVTVTPESEAVFGYLPGCSADLLDGDELECTGYVYEEFDAENLSASVYADVSCISVTDPDGRDVTFNYSFLCPAAEISFSKREIYVDVSGAEWVYDGEAHTSAEFTVTGDGDGLAEGNYAAAAEDTLTYVTDTGYAENVFDIKIFSENGTDVTACYDIVVVSRGELVVNRREISVDTGSCEWIYDGDSHSLPEWTYSGDSESEIVPGQISYTTGYASVTDVSTCPNTLSIVIFSADGTDVTDNYIISYTYGTLSVTPREIYVSSGSYEWEYDGKTHSYASFEVSDSDPGLVQGHYVRITEYAYITGVVYSDGAVASAMNTIKVSVFDGNDIDVTDNYEIIYSYGTLTVTPLSVTAYAGSKEFEYDGTGHRYEYFESTGTVSGQTLTVVSSPVITDVGSEENILEFAVTGENGEDLTQNYTVTCVPGTLTVYPREITVRADDVSKIYDGEELTGISCGSSRLPDPHTMTCEFEGSQTVCGATAVSVVPGSVHIYDADGTDVTDNYYIVGYEDGTLTVTVRPVLAVTGTVTFIYGDEDYSYASFGFSSDGDYMEPVSGHEAVAVAETLTYVRDVSDSGAENIFEIRIYSDGIDVTENYEISYEYGYLYVDRRPVTIETCSASFMYDGTEHSQGDFTDAGYTDGDTTYFLAEGHEAKYDSALTVRTDAGDYENVLYVRIYSGDTDVTDNYDIRYVYGTLTIERRPVQVVTGSTAFVYFDGYVSCDVYEICPDGENCPGLVQGHVSAVDEDTLTYVRDVSESGSLNVFEIRIYSDGIDVTDNYDILYVYGTFTVERRTVYYETEGMTFVYDGEEHSWGYASLSEGGYGLVEGHTEAYGSMTCLTDAGSADNVIEILIYSGDTDVTDNYEIIMSYGTIEITKRAVYYDTESRSFVYDGSDHVWAVAVSSAENGEHENAGLVDGHYFAPDGETPSQRYVLYDADGNITGTENVFSVLILSSDGEDVTKNYEIIAVSFGYLTVTPRDIQVASGDGTFVYDGTAHSFADEEDLSIEEMDTGAERGLVDGETVEVASLTYITRVLYNESGDITGKENIFEIRIYDADGVDVTGCYEIEYTFGCLTVTRRPVYVVSGDGTFVYDGTAHSLADTKDIDVEEMDTEAGSGMVTGEYIEVASLTYITRVLYDGDGNVTGKENVIAVNIMSDFLGDVTDCYEITYAFGYLTVTKRPVYVVSGDGTWVYDALEHSLAEIGDIDVEEMDTEAGSGMVTGEHIEVTSLTYITRVLYDEDGNVTGKENVIAVNIMSDCFGDVTDCYEITYVFGCLTVTKRPVTVTTGSHEWIYDGKTYSYLDFVDGIVLTATDDGVGIVDGQEYVVLEGYATARDVSLDGDSVVPVADTLLISVFAGDDDVTDCYEITYVYGEFLVMLREMIFVTGSDTWVYDGEEHSDGDIVIDEASPNDFAEGQSGVSLGVPVLRYVAEEENVFDIIVLDGDGEDVTGNYLILFSSYGTVSVVQREIWIYTEDCTWVYDDTDHSHTVIGYAEGTPYVILGDETYSATGRDGGDIPSIRYVGTETNSFDILIFNGDGDITYNYDIKVIYDGCLEIIPRDLTITVGGASKVYDGTPLTCEEFYCDNLVEWHTVSAPTHGELTYVGEETNVICVDEVTIMSGDTDVTGNYNIFISYGTLEILVRPVDVMSGDRTWVYDGTAHSFADAENLGIEEMDTEADRGLVDGETVEVVSLTYIIRVLYDEDGNVTGKENAFEIKIFDASETDVTFCYEITYVFGEIMITPRPVSVVSGDGTWVYDGTAHSLADIENIDVEEMDAEAGSGMVTGEYIMVASLTYITRVLYDENGDVTGKENVIAVVILSDCLGDVTDCYEITYVFGCLTVTKRPVYVVSGDGTWVYDALEHSLAEIGDIDVEEMDTEAGSGMVTGEHIMVTSLTSVTRVLYDEDGNVTGKENVIEVVILSDCLGDVTDCYEITYVFGCLTVTKRPVTVTTGSHEWIYDGKTYSYLDFVDGIVLTATDDGVGIVDWQEYVVLEGYATARDVSLDGDSVVPVADTLLISVFAGDDDVTDCYEITYVYGEFLVMLREMIFVTGSDTWVYDGEEHSDGDIVIDESSPNDFAEGQSGVSLGVPVLRYVAEEENVFDIIVLDGDGEDVTGNYLILFSSYGTVSVVQREIWIYTGDCTWVYDDTDHSHTVIGYMAGTDEYDASVMTAYEIAPGETYVPVPLDGGSIPSVRYVGSVDNIFGIYIIDGDGQDVTGNYSINIFSYGIISVTKRDVTLTASDASKVYDGTPLTCGEFYCDNLVDGHTVSAGTHGEITYAGIAENIIYEAEVTIMSGDTDVTGNYNIFISYGVLEVIQRPIYVTSEDWTGVYDGEAHGVSDPDMIHIDGTGDGSGLAEGDTMITGDFITISTVQYDADGVVTGIAGGVEISIYSPDGTDVTYCYDITSDGGTLTLLPREIEISTGSASWVYDGEEHSHADEDSVGVETEGDGRGLVAGETWYVADCAVISAVVYENGKISGVPNTVAVCIYSDSLGDVTDCYDITYVLGTLTVTARSVTVTTGSASWVYDGTAHSHAGDGAVYVEAASDGRGLIAGETWYVTDFASVTTVSEVENAVTIAVHSDSLGDVTDCYEITYVFGTMSVTKRPLTVTTGSGTWVYDGEEHGYFDLDDGITLSVTDDGTGMVDGQTYEVTAYVTVKDVNYSDGETASVQDSVTVSIYSGSDNVTDCYEITYVYGSLLVLLREVWLVSGSDTWVYDGTSHTSDTVEVASDSPYGFADGEEYVVTQATSIKYVGEAENVAEIAVRTSRGIDVTGNYDIKFVRTGTVSVTQREIWIYTESSSHVYDDTDFSYPYIGYATDVGVAEGDYYVAVPFTGGDLPSLRNVGTAANAFDILIYNEDGDVTYNYDIHIVSFGYLEVVPREIIISAGSASKYYDGTPLSCDSVYGDNLVEGHVISVPVYGSLTYAGTADNVIYLGEITIMSGDTDVTSNYSITVRCGILEILKRPVTVTTGGSEWVYDGVEHSYASEGSLTVEEEGISDGRGILAGETWQVTYYVTAAKVVYDEDGNVAGTENIVEIKIFDASGTDVTDCYDIAYVYGTLTVTPRPVTVVTGDWEGVYDGEAHGSPEILYIETATDYADSGIVDGETWYVSDYAVIVRVIRDGDGNVSGTPNTVTVSVMSDVLGDVTGCYDFTCFAGTLTLLPVALEVETMSETWEYDGTEHIMIDGMAVTGLVSTDIYNVLSYSVIRNVEYDLRNNMTSVTNEVEISVFNTSVLEDVTDCYDITYIFGTLTVTPRPITVETGSAEWLYDGEEHVCEEWTDVYVNGSGSGIVGDDRLVLRGFTGLTYVGSEENIFASLTVYGPDARQSEGNYDIEIIYGTITVYPRELTLTTGSMSWEYDGEWHSQESYTVSGDGAAPGDTISVSGFKMIMDYGMAQNTADTLTVKDGNGDDVLFCYNVTWSYGLITVAEQVVSVKPVDVVKTYDGTPLVATALEGVSADDRRIFSQIERLGYTIEYGITGSQTEIGVSESRVTYMLLKDMYGDYSYRYGFIYSETGSIEVTGQAVITVYLYDVTAVYTGERLSYEEDDYYYIASDDDYTFVMTGLSGVYLTDAGVVSLDDILSSVTYAVYYEGMDVTDSVTVRFDTEYLLTVYKAEITVTSRSAELEYTGEAQTYEYFDISVASPMPEGYVIEAYFTASVTDEDDVAENSFTVKIFDADGRDITDNYEITYVFGEISVV